HARDSAGKFTDMAGSAPEVSLATPGRFLRGADIGPCRVRTDLLDDFPEWPSDLPEPELDWDYDASESGHGYMVRAKIGDVSVSGWRNIYGDFECDAKDECGDILEADQVDAVEEYLRAGHERTETVVTDIEWNALNADGMREAARAAIAGEPIPALPAAIMSDQHRDEGLKILRELDAARSGEHGDQSARDDALQRAERLLRTLVGDRASSNTSAADGA
ncbi:MAG: hypothetical protein V4755_09365, partial [Curtobacterium sp.]